MKIISIILFLLIITSQFILGQIPQTVSFQGMLIDSKGIVVENGDYNLTFKLFDSSSDGTLLWEETQVVTISRGIFNVILGKVNPLSLSFNRKCWLGVSIDKEEEQTPRIELTSSFYSLNSKSVEDSSISTVKLKDEAVTTVKLNDGAVTQSKLSQGITLPPGGTAGGDLTGVYPNPSIADNAVNSSKIEDNTITNEDIITSIISSVNGVSNDGGNVDLVGGSNIIIVPNDESNTITISTNSDTGGASVINDLGDAIYDGSSLFIGQGSGINDDGTNYNTAIGLDALNSNITGYNNTALGYQALYKNTTGRQNIATGYMALYSNISGFFNTAIGAYALYTNTYGRYNTANGYKSLNKNISGNNNTGNGTFALFVNTIGYNNTGIGSYSLYLNEDGNNNTAVGYNSLYYNRSAQNTAVGSEALYKNGFGSAQVAIGYQALYANLTGNYNTAIGFQALYSSEGLDYQTACGYKTLYSNTSGINNSAFGALALYSNTSGYYNSANGVSTLYSNTIGLRNTANGAFALYSNTEGNDNVAVGYEALNKNTTGGLNIAIGAQALYANIDGYFNTANGKGALSNNTTGSENTAVGYYSGPSSSNLFNTTSLGSNASVSTSHTIRIGNSSVLSIGGYADWSDFSDGRYKNNIYEDVVGIDFIMDLRPITYTLDVEQLASKLGENIRIGKNGNRRPADVSPEMVEARQLKSSKREVGFVAQEVEELANRLGFDFSGVEVPENENSFYRLRYAEFVVPLVKAVQEQQEMIEELRAEIDALKRNNAK